MAPVQVTKKGSPAGSGSAFIRMYRHGLGDCFLLRFPREEGGTFNILIDCGIIAVAKDPKDTMQAVVKDIADACGNRIDIVVMTHEHWDHASGFSKQQAQDLFDEIQIDEVWYAWTEDPDNRLGKKLRKEREAKLAVLTKATVALAAAGTEETTLRAQRVESMLRFFGYTGEEGLYGAARSGAPVIGKTREAFEYLKYRRGVRKKYRKPTDQPIELHGVPDVRVYVLGPPADEKMLKRSSPTKSGKEVYDIAAELAVAGNLEAAFDRMGDPWYDSLGRDCPFEPSFARRENADPVMSEKLTKLKKDTWDATDEAWRRIESDWTGVAESLALNLDNHTNNTCLVLAFELVRSGRVLLFPADAQVGNWLSWQECTWHLRAGGETKKVDGADLLRRTSFYKVGHHGSHNATLRALGLEQMTSNELVAFIPVFKEQAKKSGWGKMPFVPLVSRLKEKTSGRLVVSDEAVPSAQDLSTLMDKERKGFLENLAVGPDELYYEYRVPLG
jgi:hypothetical protein